MIPFVSILLSYASKGVTVGKALFSKKGLVLCLPLAMSLPVFNQTHQALWFLFWLMVGDFGTGILASRVEKKKLEEINPGLRKQSLISSEKLKKSGYKILLYVSTILVVYQAQNTFKLKTFHLSFSELELSAFLITVLFWCVVEFYSIVFENFKKMGFDVLDKFNKMVDVFKAGKSKIDE